MRASARGSIPADAPSFPIPVLECRPRPGIRRAIGGTRYLSQRKSLQRGLSILSRPHAEDEVSLRRQEALQEDGVRQAEGPARVLEPHARAQVPEAQALVRA